MTVNARAWSSIEDSCSKRASSNRHVVVRAREAVDPAGTWEDIATARTSCGGMPRVAGNGAVLGNSCRMLSHASSDVEMSACMEELPGAAESMPRPPFASHTRLRVSTALSRGSVI